MTMPTPRPRRDKAKAQGEGNGSRPGSDGSTTPAAKSRAPPFPIRQGKGASSSSGAASSSAIPKASVPPRPVTLKPDPQAQKRVSEDQAQGTAGGKRSPASLPKGSQPGSVGSPAAGSTWAPNLSARQKSKDGDPGDELLV